MNKIEKNNLFIFQHTPLFLIKEISKRRKTSLLKAFFKKMAFILILSTTASFSQQLSIDEAITYLEEVVNEDLSNQINIYKGTKRIAFSVVKNEINIKYIWDDNKSVIDNSYLQSNINYNEISFLSSKITLAQTKNNKTKKIIALKCLDGSKNCFKMENEALKINFSKDFCDRPMAYNHYDFIHLFYLSSLENQEKVLTVLNYILFELNKTQNKKEDYTIKKINTLNKTESIVLKKQNGVSYLNINIGGIKADVILDSGASDVSISKHFEKRLLEKGIIKIKDYLPSGLYSIADGSIVKSQRFTIPFIRLNNTVIKNVRCSINNSEDIILLGRTFLDRFKSWEINNETNKLILKI